MTTKFKPKTYMTRIDQFRVRENLDLRDWARTAGIHRTQLNRYRSDVAAASVSSLVKLVRAASQLLGRHVKASEIMDLGDDEPVAADVERVNITDAFDSTTHPSRLDRLMHRLEVPPVHLARRANVSIPTLRKFRAEISSPTVTTLRKLVVAFRRLGHDVSARDIVDIGED